MRVGHLNTLYDVFSSEKISQGNNFLRIHNALGYFKKIEDASTPNHELNLTNFFISESLIVKALLSYDFSQRIIDEMKYIMKKYRTALHEMGYRTDIQTVQEHKLMGSKCRYDSNPYIPIGVMKGDLTIEEAIKARRLVKYQFAIKENYIIPQDISSNLVVDDSCVRVRLEDLAEDGTTVFDPRLCNSDFEIIPTEYNSHFPFRRINI
jgi:hypothetical protein